MRKFLIIILLLFVIAVSIKTDRSIETIPLSNDIEFYSTVILIPLDSRPACGDFVVNAGRIAGVKVMLPPSKLLDYFTIPGETKDIKKWLLEEAPKADALIISIDQLLNGGLIASREKNLSNEEIDDLISYLIELREIIPDTPIYAFNILPRTQPQSSIDNYQQRRALMAYSRLTSLAHAGLTVDNEALFEAVNEIKPDNLNNYLNHFNQCEILSKRLIELLQAGILNKLIIGLDDGEEFSIQNKVLDDLQHFKYDSISRNTISFVHGADEIALTLLTELAQNGKRSLKVCVKYNEVKTPGLTLPFMAVPIETVVKEKCNQLRCEVVALPEEADFILYISVNDKYEGNDDLYDVKSDSARYISQLIEKGHKVALIDLGIHFDKEETLLPLLIDRAVPINSLLAYSGWNTASNAIGIALSQAVIAVNSDNLVENLTFLNQRFLEDYFYLKDVIDTVNHALKKSGSYDTSYLDYDTELEFATFVMRIAMNKKIADYKYSKAFRRPLKINGNEVYLKDFDFSISYPWPRTFEVKLKVNNLTLSQVK
ncbi:MAG: DUF4127 family protein [Selenomonadaceae bacterium]|nr:DUF4127 family protein [Selenomonadaceae bacterium]